MKVLVACEFSGIVRDAFIAAGHDAVSCDLLPTERPGPHIQGDVLDLLYRPGGEPTAFADTLDLMIAHPPCQYLALSGARWLYGGKGTTIDPVRWARMERAAAFFASLVHAPVRRIAVENPIMHRHAKERIGPHGLIQTVQPWQFGHPESKATRFWLVDLPPLQPTNVLSLPPSGRWENQTPSGQNRLGPSPDRWKIRSRTYQGIAAAMADQWGSL